MIKFLRSTTQYPGGYSFSKYFGCTGWRLAVIAVHEDHILDKKIGELFEDKKDVLHDRYDSIHLYPEQIKFIDRMVVDSRLVTWR